MCLGAVVLAYGGVFSPEAAAVAVGFAEKGVETPVAALFFDDVAVSVALAERPARLPSVQRLFGRGRREKSATRHRRGPAVDESPARQD